MFDIIVPTFKTPLNLLKECLDSIKNQIHKDYTVWICDGTPHDWGRYDAMIKLFSEYPDFNVIRQSGKGVSQARNQVIRMGKAPLIAFLDSDDSWNPDYLHVMGEAALQDQAESNAVWFCEVRSMRRRILLENLMSIGIDAEVGVQLDNESLLQSYGIVNMIPSKYHLHFHSSSPIWFSGAVFLRSAMEMTNLFDETLKVSEDTILLLEILNEGFTTVHIHYIGVKRNLHDGQITAQEDVDESIAGAYIRERYPDMRNEMLSDEDLTIFQKHTLLEYMEGGRAMGISNRDCKMVYSIVDKETYEIDSL